MKPIIAFTMGEPSGIGPELCLKAITDPEVQENSRSFILGDQQVLLKALETFQRELNRPIDWVLHERESSLDPMNWEFGPNRVHVIDFKNVNMNEFTWAKDTHNGGLASGEYIAAAVDLALEKKAHAVVTAPISKYSFTMGGWGKKYPGHTEMLADLTNTEEYTMLLAHGNLRAVHVTSHMPMREVVEAIKKERVLRTIRLAGTACRMFGYDQPRVAVCGLNPHAGENGRLGWEDENEIRPAVQAAQAEGLQVSGPFPADTMWSKVLSGYYHIGVAMYHDQGGIPLKLVGFQHSKVGSFKTIRGINLTVGIPIIRVSPDHGTAYDIAGKGIATPDSMLESATTAIRLARVKFGKNPEIV